MAITLISNIKQANNGTFWLVDSNDIRGGLYHVDSVAEMNVLPTDNLKEGMLCYVAAEEKFYQYKKDADGQLKFDVWKVGFDKEETFTELSNKTIINSIIANSDALTNLQKQVDAITGTGEGGDATTIAGLNAQLASLKTTVGKATEGDTAATGLFARIEALEKQLAAHTHEIADVTGLQAALDDKAVKSDFDALKELVGTLPETATASNVVGYVDEKVAALVDGAPETLDTLKELADALGNDKNAVTTLTTAIGKKADASALEALQQTVETNKGNADTVSGKVDALDAILKGFGGTDEPATVKDSLEELKTALGTKVDQNTVNTSIASAVNKFALSGSEDDSNLTISLDFGNGEGAVQLGKVDIPVITVTEVETIINNLDKETV
jgi:hypothetical protein